jgi:ethanolamine ammonia-lyase small subunit
MSARSAPPPQASNPARLGVGRAGPRYTTAAMLQFRADHARAVDAVVTEVGAQWARHNRLTELRSEAVSREEYLLRPERGRRLRAEDIVRLKLLNPRGSRADAAKPSVLICLGDGLSSTAVEANAAALLRALTTRLRRGYRVLKPVFIRNARVRIEDHIGEILRPDLVCMLIGERPGLATAESLSAYVIYRPRLTSLEPDRTVISNIHSGGIVVPEAARKIAALVADAVRFRATGARLAERIAAQ